MAGKTKTAPNAGPTKPISLNDLRLMIAATPADLHGARDRALLLTGFAASLTPKEVRDLRVDDLRIKDDNVVLRLRDREVTLTPGRFAATSPVRALQNWIDESGITSGWLLRAVDQHGHLSERQLSPRSVNVIVTAAAARAGLDVTGINGKSLRAGALEALDEALKTPSRILGL